MTRKTIATLGILVVLLVSMFGTAAGQGEVTDPTPPPPEGEETVTTYYEHPIVQLLSGYFGRNLQSETDPVVTEEPVDDAEGEDTEGEDTEGDEVVDGEAPEDGEPVEEFFIEDLTEQIVTLREEGIGFGVLVKLYSLAEMQAEASVEACAEAPVPTEGETVEECVPATMQELVEVYAQEFQSGTGMGQFFKEYGKPAMMGVGHVKKAMKAQEEEPVVPVEPDEEVITDGETELEDETLITEGPQNNGNKPDKAVKPVKEKSNNGRGPKKP